MSKRFLWLTLMLSGVAFGQIGMNQWRIHFSAYKGVGTAAAGEDVFMACTNGIVNYDIGDQSINFITITNGLSDLGISCIASDDTSVYVGYLNGNIDIIEGNSITNIPWIKLADLQGSKSVNNFYFSEDYVYISSSAGLVVFDPEKSEIKDTYHPYTNPIIYDATILQDTLFVGTAEGIYYAHRDAPFLNDQSQWNKLTSLPAVVVDADITELEAFGDKLVFAYDGVNYFEDSIYTIEAGTLSSFAGNPVNIEQITTATGQLILVHSSSVQFLDNAFAETNLIYQYPGLDPPNPRGVTWWDNQLWIADSKSGFIRASNAYDGVSLFSKSPYTDGSYRIDIQYGKVLVAGGGVTHNLLNNYFRNGVYVFQNEAWTNFNYENSVELDYDKDWDHVAVAVNPSDTSQFAFAGFNDGGIKVVSDGVNITQTWDTTNSPLELAAGSKMAITDLRYDDDDNLWVLNQGNEPLKCFAADGSQYSFAMGSAAKGKYPFRLMIDSDGLKWGAFTNAGLSVLDDGGTLDDPSDDQLQTLSAVTGYGNLPSATVKAIAEDIDGEIWIGTEEGLVVLYSTADLFTGDYGDYDASAILVEVDGEVEKLLGTTYISSIAVDGGNRKWIGTSSSGVFCLSPDGLEEIYRFTTDNSPLLSDNILDIRIDHASGEVYFATDKGLVSFRADGTIGDNDFEQVTVFPNPVRPEFGGPITIQGLGYQSDVKITDVSGNIVYKTLSNGGTAIWDGKTLQGDRVASGVYLVWSGVDEGRGKEVAKILFIH